MLNVYSGYSEGDNSLWLACRLRVAKLHTADMRSLAANYQCHDLPYAVGAWRLANEADTPDVLLSVPANSYASKWEPTSGLWFVANGTNHIQPIGDQCYYITERCGALYIRLG